LSPKEPVEIAEAAGARISRNQAHCVKSDHLSSEKSMGCPHLLAPVTIAIILLIVRDMPQTGILKKHRSKRV
jgi:hypothetical protein